MLPTVPLMTVWNEEDMQSRVINIHRNLCYHREHGYIVLKILRNTRQPDDNRFSYRQWPPVV